MAKVTLNQDKKRKEDIGSWTKGWLLTAVATGISIILLFVGVTVIRVSDITVENVHVNDGLRVPDVRNLPGEEAKKALEDKGFIVEMEEKISAVIPEGYIVEQTIKPGMAMAGGETISLMVSSGAQIMPDIREFVLEDAQALLDTMKIQYEVVEEENQKIAPGAIISQSIAPNEQVGKERVLLKVALNTKQEKEDETIQVQDFTGRLYEDVKKELQEQGGYLAKCAWEYHDELPMGSIVSQRIAGGSEIGSNEVIAVAVNIGFTQAEVPDVTDKSVEEAMEILKKKGMLVTLTYENSTEVAADNIIEQDISQEEKAVGTNITLCVSRGNKNEASEADNLADNSTVAVAKQVIDWTTDSSLANNPQYTCEMRTEYRYQTRTKSKETTTSTSSSLGGWTMTGSTQSQGDWGSWSGWSESAVSGSGTRQVESRESVKHGDAYDYIVTEYRYRDRSVRTTYHFEREVYSGWSGWSEWQQGAIGANDCTNVETRTLYKYTEK